MTKRKQVIAVDFDGTIVTHEYPYIGNFLPGAKEALQYIAKHCEILLFTCREEVELEKALEFLNKWEIKITFVNEVPEPYKLYDKQRKPVYDVLIDDRNFGTTVDWHKIHEFFYSIYK